MLTEFHEISHKCSADDFLLWKRHILSSELYLHAIFIKKLPFLAKKSVSNFFGSHSGKMKLIFLIYTFFRTCVQKIGDGLFIFIFFFKGTKLSCLADIWPPAITMTVAGWHGITPRCTFAHSRKRSSLLTAMDLDSSTLKNS